jgi:hypothetical protein
MSLFLMEKKHAEQDAAAADVSMPSRAAGNRPFGVAIRIPGPRRRRSKPSFFH